MAGEAAASALVLKVCRWANSTLNRLLSASAALFPHGQIAIRAGAGWLTPLPPRAPGRVTINSSDESRRSASRTTLWPVLGCWAGSFSPASRSCVHEAVSALRQQGQRGLDDGVEFPLVLARLAERLDAA